MQGIRPNWRQFVLQTLTVLAVGVTMGANRNVVPVMGEETFGVDSVLVIAAFVVSFGLVKAVLNLYAGRWGDRYGRKPVLIAGWLAAVPIPFVLTFAPTWTWIVLGNVLLGINQGVTWSMSLTAKIDLAGPAQRGLAAGIDEAAGYAGVAVGAWVTGVIAARYGLRPAPFIFLLSVVLVAVLLAIGLLRETRALAQAEASSKVGTGDGHDAPTPSFFEVFKRATYGDRTLFATALAGHVENFVDTLVWIGVPLFLLAQGLDTAQIGVVVGVHNGAYLLQLYTGRLGDKVGRKPPIVAGILLAGVGVFGMMHVESYPAWAMLSLLSGVGMALHYPNLIAVACDAVDPYWRSTSLGVYRLWRDLGYAVGAVWIGLVVDFVSIEAAFYATAGAMSFVGVFAYMLMEETHPEIGSHRRMPLSPSDD